VRQELDKIKEMTPGARERVRWEEARDGALETMADAQRRSAPRYAPRMWSEAQALFERASRYAGEDSFLKAEFLAREARDVAERAAHEAETVRAGLRQDGREKIDRLKVMLDGVSGKISLDDEGASKRIRELFLEWRDLGHALELEQFSEVSAGAPRLEKRIRAFRAESLPHARE